MARESMIFYASWWESIKELPANVRNEVLNTIVEYGIEGVMTSEQGQMTKAIMALIKPQIDANNQKYENGCKGGEYGVLGGRPRKNPKETPKKPLMIKKMKMIKRVSVPRTRPRSRRRKRNFISF